MSYMAPFSFPNPGVQTSVIHPDTGEYWVYEDGVWMVSDDDPCSDDNHTGPIPPTTPTPDPTGGFDETIGYLRSEIATLRADIIELRAQLSAATVNNFLILE